MKKDEEPESPSWSASFLMQTTEDVAKAVAAAAAAIGSPRPSVVYSSKDESSGSQLNKFQHTVSRILKGLSTPPEIRGGSYNPEVLTSQKRQWAHIQLQTLDHRVWKDPTKLFESMVVVGLPPSSDVQALQNLYFSKKSDSPGRLRNALGGQHQSRIEPNLEPQVLFVYPPEKQLPLKYKDLLSFCFPAGVEVNAVEKTPSMSELNEILIGQEHLKQRDLSFVFRLQVADASTLYGCCVLVEEMIQKPSRLISTVSDVLPFRSGLSRHSLTTRRCYCILTRVPFFELHFGVLNSIFMEERLERLTKQVSKLNYEHSLSYDMPEISEEESGSSPPVDGGINMQNGTVEASQSSSSGSIPGSIFDDISQPEHQNLNRDSYSKKEPNDNVVPPDTEVGKLVSIPGSISDGISLPEHQNLIRDSYSKKEPYANVVPPDTEVGKLVSIPGSIFEGISLPEHQNLIRDSYSKKLPNGNVVPPDTEVGKLVSSEEQLVDYPINDDLTKKKLSERRPPSVVPPFLRFQQCESSESSSSFQGSSSEDRHFRSDLDSAETEEASSSGRYNLSEHSDILEWAKANNHGSLQIICEYYQLCCPARGSTIKFHPLDHLHPLEYHRPDETVLHDAGLRIDLRSCNTSLEFAEAHSALMVEEEAAALSVWSVACLCGSLRLEHVLTLFAAALLEKQILVVCSNLGVLSAVVLSVIPLIRPYQWQSWLMPVLPNDMLDFLDAPVPYIVGVKNKTNEVQSKLSNVVLVDANRNQVKSPTIPQLPQQKELISSLSSYHAKLVGESYLGKKRPVYECTDVQAEAAKGFLGVLRSYLDSLCSNIRSHTITNVQSNDDKVSLLLKESFIESYPSRDQPFMKLLVDTQLFSVHTDFVLSYFQKE